MGMLICGKEKIMTKTKLSFKKHIEEIRMIATDYQYRIEQIEEYYKSIIEKKDDEIQRLKDEIEDIKSWY